MGHPWLYNGDEGRWGLKSKKGLTLYSHWAVEFKPDHGVTCYITSATISSPKYTKNLLYAQIQLNFKWQNIRYWLPQAIYIGNFRSKNLYNLALFLEGLKFEWSRVGSPRISTYSLYIHISTDSTACRWESSLFLNDTGDRSRMRRWESSDSPILILSIVIT